MTVARLLFVAVTLMLVGSGIVLLKAEQVRLSYHTSALERRAVQLRARLWDQQLQMARLRSPDLVHDRYANAIRTEGIPVPDSFWAALPAGYDEADLNQP